MPPPAQQTQVVVMPSIKVGGALLSASIMNNLVELTVDTSLDVPDMFVLRFHDDQYELIDGAVLDLGKEVEIAFADDNRQPVTLMKGEITGLEPHYDEEMNTWLTVRGYDKRHRLNRGTKIRVFLNQTDSQMVQSIAGEAGVSVEVEATSVQHKYVCQHDQTDLEFIEERARLNGYELVYADDKIKFRKPNGSRPRINLAHGVGLRSFTPRLSAANQVNSVMVRGWDPVNKQAVVGQANSTSSQPQIGLGKNGGSAAQQAFSSEAKLVEVRYDVLTQAQAEKLAQSLLDEINAGFVEATGVTFGNANIKAGCEVNITQLGTRFSGVYMVTSATHTYTEEGYNTEFRVEGKKPRLLSDLASGNGNGSVFSRWQGVVPAIVTNNLDPDNYGRIKVKFPWLADDKESNWARVSSVGAGSQRGLLWLPEVNDEVLVAFEQGDFNRPIILGGLWNGQDAMPESQANTVKNGKVVRRTWKTRLGHIIRFVDDDSEKYIEIVDSAQGTTIKLDAQNKKLDITCQGEVTIKSTGKTNVETTGNLDLKSSANVSIKGAGNVNVEATGQLVLKGSVVNIN
jgi:uncharacterized protein involved in type VI secretion and phage assembly